MFAIKRRERSRELFEGGLMTLFEVHIIGRLDVEAPNETEAVKEVYDQLGKVFLGRVFVTSSEKKQEQR